MTNTNTVQTQTQIKFLDDGIKPGGTRQAKVALLLRRILEHNRNAPERETTIIVCLILRRRRRRGEALKIMSMSITSRYLGVAGQGSPNSPELISMLQDWLPSHLEDIIVRMVRMVKMVRMTMMTRKCGR